MTLQPTPPTMRPLGRLLALAVVAVLAGIGLQSGSAVPADASDPSAITLIPPQPTETCAVSREDSASLPIDALCPKRIRPGARMVAPAGCTMNFVVTDGIDLYIGTAGHCVSSVGQSVSLDGVGWIGQVAMRWHGGGDWAFVRIDPSRHHLVDPTLCRYGGPFTLLDGDAVREPVPGDPIVHYGHGFVWGATDATRARGSAVVLPWAFYGHEFVFAGIIAPGDSGSPVRFATGEAAGIAVSHLRIDPFGVVPSVAFASRFDRALENLTAYLGRPVEVVEGAMLPPEIPTPSNALTSPRPQPLIAAITTAH